jgi:hypothetical protein
LRNDGEADFAKRRLLGGAQGVYRTLSECSRQKTHLKSLERL